MFEVAMKAYARKDQLAVKPIVGIMHPLRVY